MKAISYNLPRHHSGIPEIVLTDTESPSVQKGELLVRVKFAGLNYFDFDTMRGVRNKDIRRALRKSAVISGIEMAGIAESDGVTIKQGDLVFGYTNIFRSPYFHAEYVSVPESNLARVPDNCSLEGAASILGGALTSISALERIAKLGPESKVLITGATGSVGITAVQLAKYLNAEVDAVCHSSQVEFALAEGASHAYAYDKKELPEPENQFDLVFDTAPALSFKLARKFLKSNAHYITTMPHLDISGFLRGLFSRRKWGFLLEYNTDSARMERLRSLIADGAFRPVIDSIFKLEQAPEAFDSQQKTGKRGKILIDLSSTK